jgi:endonuclease YncB( thermonuclease family)
LPGPWRIRINGVELTERKYDDFARIAGRLAKQRLNVMVNSPDWQIVSVAHERAACTSLRPQL